MSLATHRKAIDKLDAQIVKLLNERTQHALEIGNIKIKNGEEIYAPHRERAVLEKVAKLNDGPITNESLQGIYREIMSSALSLQKTMTVAYLGPEATFSHQAALRRFGSCLKYSAQKTIADVFMDVSKGRADYGVVPVENSTEGVVTYTLDMLVDSDLKIVAQIIMPIQHCLIGDCPKESIKRLYSHPQVIAQCRFWIQNHMANAEIIETSSTTRAAELVKDQPDAAALASSLAAELYDLDIIEAGVQDNVANVTRFLVLGRQCSPPTGHDRTSIMLSVADKVGALFHSLEPFNRFKLNMTKIESRPSKRKAWEYFFFIDMDGHYDDEKLQKALKLLEPHCNFVKFLGSYPNTE